MWVENTSQFNKDFIRNCNKDTDEGYFLKVNVQYPEKLHSLHNDSPLFPEKMKTKTVVKLVYNFYDKENI